MHRRFFHRCALWLLPLLAARAFVPLGFMLSVGEQGLTLAFCPAQAPALVQALGDRSGEHAAHALAGHGAIGDQQAAHTHGEDEAIQLACPYGLAATAIATDSAPLHSLALVPSDERIDWAARSHTIPGPLRADRIRGPPTYS